MANNRAGRVNAHGGGIFHRPTLMQSGQKTGRELVARAGQIDNFISRDILCRHMGAPRAGI
jgi:hypothetical protein